MSDLATLNVRVTSTGIEIANSELGRLGKNADAAERATQKLENQTKATNASFNNYSNALKTASLGALAFAGVAASAMYKAFQETAESEKAMAQLNAVIASTGGVAGKTADELAKTATNLQKLTTYSDEAVIGAQALLLTFKEVKGDNFDRATKAILDMSTAMGTDLKSSAIQIGKALNDPIQGLSALSRVGVQFTAEQKDTIKALVDMGRSAEAQVIILKELESQFGGAAEAARNTLGGALEGLNNSFGELFEMESADSNKITGAINDLNAAISDPKFKDGIQNLITGLLSVVTHSASALGALTRLGEYLGNFAATAREGVDGTVAGITRLSQELEAAQQRLSKFESEGGNKQTLAYSSLVSNVDRLTAAVALSEMAYEKTKTAADGYVDSLYDGAKAGGAVAAAQQKFNLVVNNGGKAQAELSNIVVTATRRTLNLTDAQKAQIKQQEAARKELQRQQDALGDFIGDLEFEVQISKESAREQAILTAQRRFSTVATDESAEAIRRLVGTLYDEQEAARAAAEEQDRLQQVQEEAAQASAKAAEDAMRPWNDALQAMAENIDSSFVQGWNDALGGAEDGFKNFAGNIWDSFKNLMANMLHLAFTRPIVMQISAAMGGLIPGGAAFAGGVTPGGVTPTSIVSGGLSSITSGITAAGKGLYSALGTITNDLGMFDVSNAFNAKALSTTGWTMAGDMAGGFAGKLASDKVFGETSGIGSAIGGIAGSALIPIPVLGAAIGSFLGGALEKGLGNLFGYGGNNNDGKNVARADFDFATGTFGKGAGSGNSWKKGEGKEQADFIDQLMSPLAEFGKAIGGSNLKGGVTADSRGNMTFNGKAFTDASDLLSYGFKEIVAASDKVSDRLKPLIANFDGSAEEIAAFSTGLIAIDKEVGGIRPEILGLISGFKGTAQEIVAFSTGIASLDKEVGGISDTLLTLIGNASGTAAEIMAFSGAIVSISQQASVNTVTRAIEEFNTVAPTAAEAYRDHSAELALLIQNYDGSSASAVALNDALLENKTAAYEFAMAIQEIGRQLGEAGKDSARSIRESVMTPEQLRAQRTTERDTLREALPTMTDPEEINRAVRSILELNDKIFRSLPEDQRTIRAEEFAAYAESTVADAQGILGGILTGLETTQENINTATMAMLETSAGKFQQAADTSLEASENDKSSAEKFRLAVDALLDAISSSGRGGLEVDG